MSIRLLSKELQKVAQEELHEHAQTVTEDLQHLREWLKKQQHLTVRLDDQWLLSFLRGCKWSLQRTKEKLDCFYTIRTFIPEIFQNRDPFNSTLQQMLDKGIIYPLPNTEIPGGPRVIFSDFSAIDYNVVGCVDVFKLFFITIDILMAEDDNCIVSGETLIANYGNIPLSFFVQITPALMRKLVVCWQNAYPLRIKQLVGINTPPVVANIYNTLCKPFFSKKLQNRIHLYTPGNNENAFTKIPKSLFPMELGGENGSRSTTSKQWKQKVESYRDWFLEDEKYVSNENLRVGKPKPYSEEFEIEGSFRKLNVD